VSDVWFESWGRVGALAVAFVVVYGWLVVVLRVSGKRTLAKLSAFDFVVTIALGSTLSTVIVSRDVPLVEGTLALLGLVVLQYGAARSTQQWSWFDKLVKSQPTALLVNGRLRENAMVRNRLRGDEVAAAVRKAGFASLGDVACVVLETDGTFNVLERLGDRTAVDEVDGIGPDAMASERAARRFPELLRSLAVRRSDASQNREQCL
jgi:uncharacterized membrane protein YcaP (DUF421 family)